MAEPAATHGSRGFNRPPMQVLEVTATTSYDANDVPVRTSLVEGQLTEGVTLTSSFRIRLDRFLLPSKVTRQAVCIRASTDPVASFEDCAEPLPPFTEPTYLPATREVVYRLNPGEPLAADTLYRITVFVQPEVARPGLFAFDGAPLARSYIFDFKTQPSTSVAFEEPAPSPARLCDALDCLDDCGGSPSCEDGCRPLCVDPNCENRGAIYRTTYLFGTCASSSCHSGNSAQDLDLYNNDGLTGTAIGFTAHQTQTGQAAAQPDLSPIRFGRAMPIIDPNNPGNSYLMYKLLIHPLNHLRPGGVIDPSLEAEINRLRWAVPGLPMPAELGSFFGIAGAANPVGSDPDGLRDVAKMQALEAWIASGAPLGCRTLCPAGPCASDGACPLEPPSVNDPCPEGMGMLGNCYYCRDPISDGRGLQCGAERTFLRLPKIDMCF